MRTSLVRVLSVVVAFSYAATLAACSSPAQDSATPAAVPGALARNAADGKLEIARSGSGLHVTLINPKDGAAATEQAYAKPKGDCYSQNPCYILSAINGTAPLPVSAGPCTIHSVNGAQSAYCPASGVSAVTIDAPDGGTIGHDASGQSEYGKDCFPASVIYEVGDKDVYSVLAWDGCKETIHCLGKNVGTVDADSKDVIQGPCYFVNRH